MPSTKRKAEDGGESDDQPSQKRHRGDEPSTKNAASKVLNLPELLEPILIELPWQKLFELQRVCKRWADVIRDSKTIRKKQWLHSDTAVAKTWKSHNRKCDETESFPTPFTTLVGASSREKTTAYLNPLLRIYRGSKTYFSSETLLLEFREPEKMAASILLNDESASWRDMYLTDPPCCGIHLNTNWRDNKEPHGARLSDTRPSGNRHGVLLGDLVPPEKIAKARELYFEGKVADWGKRLTKEKAVERFCASQTLGEIIERFRTREGWDDYLIVNFDGAIHWDHRYYG